MTEIRDITTSVKPGDETLVAACTNLVLGRKRQSTQNQTVFLDANDVLKVFKMIEILSENGPPPQAEAYGRRGASQVDLSEIEDALTGQPPTDPVASGDPARRGLRARLDGQQSVPTE